MITHNPNKKGDVRRNMDKKYKNEVTVQNLSQSSLAKVDEILRQEYRHRSSNHPKRINHETASLLYSFDTFDSIARMTNMPTSIRERVFFLLFDFNHRKNSDMTLKHSILIALSRSILNKVLFNVRKCIYHINNTKM